MTTSTDFPTTPGAFKETGLGSGGVGGFVVKLNPTGSVSYSTLLAGDFADHITAIAVDGAGHAYVTGWTQSSAFPTTPGAFQTARQGTYDAFVTKLKADGSGLVYATRLGGKSGVGGSATMAFGIAVDPAGNAHVTGYTTVDDFPVTTNAFQATHLSPDAEVFVTKLNATGSGLLYSTYLGALGNDQGLAIALDTIGDAYVAGRTSSPDFPMVGGFFPAFQQVYAGSNDAFVAKFSTGTPTAFSLSAILPGAGGDTGSVTTSIQGSGFTDGATVKLVRSGASDIVADSVSVAADGRTVTATFDLTGMARGAWDMVVTNPDDTSETLAGAFTIEEGRAAQVWVDILGRNTIMVGHPQMFYILVGNRGNVDAVGVPLWIAFSKFLDFRLGFEIIPPPQPEAQPTIDFSEIPISAETDTEKVVPLFLVEVPPGLLIVLRINLTTEVVSPFDVRAFVDPPLFHHSQHSQLDINPDDFGCRVAILNALLNLSGGPPLTQSERARAITYATGRYIPVLTTAISQGATGQPQLVPAELQFWLSTIAAAGIIVPNPVSVVAGGVQIGLNGIGAIVQCGLPLLERFSRSRIGQTLVSHDPNDKAGSQGATQARYLSGEEPLRYAIFFENEAAATAPAQEVVISDQLDVNRMDLTTFSLGPISFGDKQVILPPGLKQYSTDVDLRPAKDLIVRIEAGLNSGTGIVTWRFTSIDPATGQLTEDPRGGFLPPNTNPPEGDGSVLFTVMPKKSLSTGTEVRNRATIVFDANQPMDTPEWLNTIDNTKPTSQVLTLAAAQSSPSFTVQWSGSDVGSGILDYTIFVSEDGGPFTPWLLNTTATSETFTGQSDKTYAFYSVARDQTGNLEEPPSRPDTTTRVEADTIPPTTTAAASPAPNANGWNNTNVTVTLTATDNPGGSGVQDLSYALGGASTGGSVVAGSSTTVTVSTEGTTTLTYFARDNAGNWEAPKTLTVHIDKTKPVITGSSSPGANPSGWNSADVTVSFNCAEVGSVQSGIAANTVAGTTLTDEGAGQSVTNTGTCTDKAGNAADPATVSDIHIDKTPPVIAGLPAPSCTLWPPNHRLVQVAMVTASDGLSGLVSGSLGLTGASNEPDNGLGDGDLAPDIIITGGTVQLRAERAGNGSGRVYTLTATASDLAGNRAQATATCTVPHDQRR